MFPPSTGRGRRMRHHVKDITDAAFHINANGCRWIDVPHDFPPYSSASHHDGRWARDGTRWRVDDALREAAREAAGRNPRPSAGVIDSRTAEAAPTGGRRGYDGGKKTTGHERHALVDTLGLLIAVLVTSAGASDAVGAVGTLRQVSRFDQPRLAVVYADGAYHRPMLFDHVSSTKWYRLEVVGRPSGAVGFVPNRKRWVVGRTFGRLAHHRRHARDYERTYASGEAQVYSSHVRLMLRRLAKPIPPDDSCPVASAEIRSITAKLFAAWPCSVETFDPGLRPGSPVGGFQQSSMASELAEAMSEYGSVVTQRVNT